MIISPQELKAILAFTSNNKKAHEFLQTVYVDCQNSRLIATDGFSLVVFKSKDDKDLQAVVKAAPSYYVNKSMMKWCSSNEFNLHIDLITGKVADVDTGVLIGNSINIKDRESYAPYPADIDQVITRSDILATNCIYSLKGFEKMRKLISIYSSEAERFLSLQSRNSDFICFKIESNKAVIWFAIAAETEEGEPRLIIERNQF